MDENQPAALQLCDSRLCSLQCISRKYILIISAKHTSKSACVCDISIWQFCLLSAGGITKQSTTKVCPRLLHDEKSTAPQLPDRRPSIEPLLSSFAISNGINTMVIIRLSLETAPGSRLIRPRCKGPRTQKPCSLQASRGQHHFIE
jgi:hypothetical protein